MDEDPRADRPDENDEPDAAEELGLDAFAESTEESELSLEALSEAYAQLIEGRRGTPREPPPVETAAPVEPESPVDAADDPDDHCKVTPQSILEALLFVGNPDNAPLTSRQVASFMRCVGPREIDQAVVALNQQYEAEGCSYRIASVESGYVLRLREPFAPLREKFYGKIREARLSQAAIDILAVVAYHQPLTRAEIDKLRGAPSGAILTQLVRRQLLAVERLPEKPREMRYRTTDRFLHLFGLSAIDELPQPQNVDKSF